MRSRVYSLSLCPWRLDCVNYTRGFLSKLGNDNGCLCLIPSGHVIFTRFIRRPRHSHPVLRLPVQGLYHLLLFFISLDLGLVTALLLLALGLSFFFFSLTFLFLLQSNLQYFEKEYPAVLTAGYEISSTKKKGNFLFGGDPIVHYVSCF